MAEHTTLGNDGLPTEFGATLDSIGYHRPDLIPVVELRMRSAHRKRVADDARRRRLQLEEQRAAEVPIIESLTPTPERVGRYDIVLVWMDVRVSLLRLSLNQMTSYAALRNRAIEQGVAPPLTSSAHRSGWDRRLAAAFRERRTNQEGDH